MRFVSNRRGDSVGIFRGVKCKGCKYERFFCYMRKTIHIHRMCEFFLIFVATNYEKNEKNKTMDAGRHLAFLRPERMR